MKGKTPAQLQGYNDCKIYMEKHKAFRNKPMFLSNVFLNLKSPFKEDADEYDDWVCGKLDALIEMNAIPQ